MRELKEEPLNKYTTINIGGIADLFLIPENTSELLNIVSKYKPDHYIGGGSNLLIDDKKRFPLVVNLRDFDTSIEHKGNGVFKVGASARLQSFINEINNYGYGGIEYLYSVPGLVGGAVVMNAGRGRSYNKCISDYIDSVTVIKDNSLISVPKSQCRFEYRNSIFKNSDYIITSVDFSFPRVIKEDADREKKERIELCRKVQDARCPNFGTVFLSADSMIMSIVKKIKLGGKKAHFSNKTPNWILNENNADFNDVINIIRKVEFAHKLVDKTCEREVIVWD